MDATHYWIDATQNLKLPVYLNGGNIFTLEQDAADPNVQPRATYELADSREEDCAKNWVVLVGGEVQRKARLVEI